VNDYGQEFMDAWDRTVRFGLALPPIRFLVRKNCIDLAKALPVIVDYFNRHSGEGLVGQTMAIHNMLLPPLCDALGVPLQLTIGWIEFNGTPRMQHGEALIQRFLTEKWAAWHREGVPFHLWLTSPALEVLDVTFALNLGWATSAEDCARRVIYQPLHAPQGNPIYHPTLVGDDFFVQSGAIVDLLPTVPVVPSKGQPAASARGCADISEPIWRSCDIDRDRAWLEPRTFFSCMSGCRRSCSLRVE
jgi:hypothetical protein